MRKLHLILFMGIACLVACSKSISEEDSAANQRAKDFQASVLSHKYKIVAFYADKPIDYITNDTEVKSETDLWAYVKAHIMDDENLFGANNSLTIYQKSNKMVGNESETVNANYEIFAKGPEVAVNFIDYSYKSLEYKLHEFDNAYFTVYVDGPNGSKLFTKFARVE
jgi:hypothetical protein